MARLENCDLPIFNFEKNLLNRVVILYCKKKKKEEKNACKILIIRYNLSLQVQNKIRWMYLYPDASLNSIDYFTRYRIQIENNNNCVPFLAGWRGLKEKSILQSIQTLWYCITFVTLLRNLIVRIIDQFSRIKIRVENLFFFLFICESFLFSRIVRKKKKKLREEKIYDRNILIFFFFFCYAREIR